MWNWLAKHPVAQGIPEATALRTLSLGFALGILVGRVVVSRILIRISPINVTLASSILMALTTWGMLQITTLFSPTSWYFARGSPWPGVPNNARNGVGPLPRS